MILLYIQISFKGGFMKINKNYLILMSLGFILLLSSFFKLTSIIGSYKLFFSGINFSMPILGAFIKPLYLPFIFIFFLLKKITFGGALTLGIPTFMATLVIAFANKDGLKYKIYDFLLRVILPLLAIVLFLLNSVGRQAFIYSFYWFIPVILFLVEMFFNKKYIFTIFLSATFIAHSVGSLIWLYTLNTTPYYWLSLISLVAVERFLFACGMHLSYIFINNFLRLKSNLIIFRSYKCFLK